MKNYQISANCPDKLVIQSPDYTTSQIDKHELINNISRDNQNEKKQQNKLQKSAKLN